MLENQQYRVELDLAQGKILRILDKTGPVDLAASPGLADNYRILLPTLDAKRNFILGKEQKLSGAQTIRDGVILHWDGPLKDAHGVAHNLSVNLSIRLVLQSIEFTLTLDNKSRYEVTEVWYPLLGGLQNFGPPEFRAQTTLNPPPANKQLQQPFGEYLVLYPGQLNMGFVDVYNPGIDRGMYFASHDKIARLKGFQFAEALGGTHPDLLANVIHFPSTPPGERFEGSTVVIQFHNGDWRKGGKIYREWFKKTFGLMDPSRDWIRRQTFFQATMFLLPEGNVNTTFKEIPRWAKDAHDHGVNAVQINGWQRGGHDNGYPYYEPDPRLGTWEELEAGIRACHEMGVKVYFFVNLHPVMLDLQWYQEELKDYLWENKDGVPYWIDGWGMGTLASRMMYTTPQLVFADPSFPKFARHLVDSFKKLAEIGADGLHIDKMFPGPMNFNPRARLSPDRSPWEGVLRVIDRINTECKAVNPDFSMSFESNWDRILQYGNAIWWGGFMASAKMVFPEVVETVGHYQPYDYIGINDAVRMGYVIMLAPHQFNRSIGYEPWKGLAAYVKEVKRIRDELIDTVFFGEYLDTEEVEFLEKESNTTFAFRTFRNLETGKRACIVTNSDGSPCRRTLLNFEGNTNGRVRVYQPFEDATEIQLPAKVEIHPERIAFVVEL